MMSVSQFEKYKSLIFVLLETLPYDTDIKTVTDCVLLLDKIENEKDDELFCESLKKRARAVLFKERTRPEDPIIAEAKRRGSEI